MLSARPARNALAGHWLFEIGIVERNLRSHRTACNQQASGKNNRFRHEELQCGRALATRWRVAKERILAADRVMGKPERLALGIRALQISRAASID